MDEEVRVFETAAAGLVRRVLQRRLSLVITAEPDLHTARMFLFIQYRFLIMIIVILCPIIDKALL